MASVAASRTAAGSGNSDPPTERDARTQMLHKEVIHADISHELQQKIIGIALSGYERFVLLPTKATPRKEEAQKKELEREVERTNMREIAQYIKKECDAQLGPLWHVVYGRSFATFVTHERMSFFHFTIDGANVCVWKHGA